MPKVEEWLNHTMADSNDFSPVELMFNETRPDLFKKFLKKEADQLPPDERLMGQGVTGLPENEVEG